jgi:hypothetical protein
MSPDTEPEKLTTEGLQECKDSLAATARKLEKHMKDLIDRLVTKSRTATTSDDDVIDLARLRDEWDTARQCVDICSKASLHLKENVSTIDNYGTGDAVQFMVSTDGKTIHGRNRGLGWRTRQLGGHVNDASLQKVSGDFSYLSIQRAGGESPSSPSIILSDPAEEAETKAVSTFKERYGHGFKLAHIDAEGTSVATPDGVESTHGNSMTE